MISESHLQVTKTARVFFAGNAADVEVDTAVIVLHGYGMLPSYFLRKFEPLSSDKWLFVAPEGLHRFYTQGSSGRVGASWMTKEDRLTDIAYNNKYLDQIMDIPAVAGAKKKVLLGFSQGTATAVRYYCQSSIQFDQVILWAGVFPHDLSLPENVTRLNETALEIVVGKQDEYLTSDAVLQVSDLLKEAGVKCNVTWFEGTHVIDGETLIKVLNG